jgi:hypothetical protein
MFLRRAPGAILLLLPLAAASSCTSAVDVKEAIEIADASGGWYDGGIVDGKNKIVPMVSFRLRKKAEAEVDAIAVNVVFRHPPVEGAATEEDWDEVFIQRAAFTEGNQTPPLSVRTEKGYTGDPPQSRTDLFKNSQFRDVRARIYARYASTQWVDIGTIDVPRQLITR